MGIAANQRGLSIEGASVSVQKHMGSTPRRHISRIDLEFLLPASLPERPRILLEAVAEACPVSASLGPDTQVNMQFEYAEL
jgi:uncharacterized OsmC-like protein